MKGISSSTRATLWLLSLFIACAAALVTARALTAQEMAPDSDPAFRGPTAASLDGDIRLERTRVAPGETVDVTLVLSNHGDASLATAAMSNTLPQGVTYVADSLTAPEGTTFGFNAGVVTWTGPLLARSEVIITYQVVINADVAVGGNLVTTMALRGGADTISRTVTTAVVAEGVPDTLLPIIQKPVPTLNLVAGRPTNSNNWTLSWNDLGSVVTNYEVHESQSATFDTFTVINAGTTPSVQVSRTASWRNFYYYRVRANGAFGNGPWSNVVLVMGNYRDDFNDTNSDWKIRRMSLLEETYGYYLDGSFVMLIDDRWDWAAASPLSPAPPIPYEIEYRSKNHNITANLVSGGAFFGADWNGDACPEIGNVYQTDNCLNHFYNFNYIFFGPIKLLFEQVNELVWCPGCGGSALKRIGPTQDIGDVIPSGPSEDWHTYRIEVRSDGARLYIDNNFIRHFTDTSFINDPYFGVFASTDEYKPSIWFFDWFAVRYLD